jgi:hypothetical protein
MPCWQSSVDHKVVVYWVAAIAPGPLPSYVTGLAPASPGHHLPVLFGRSFFSYRTVLSSYGICEVDGSAKNRWHGATSPTSAS